MGKILSNYKYTLILLIAIIIGGFAGFLVGPKIEVIKPFGDLFLNLMFMIIVPLVFFSVASAIANTNGMKRLGKILGGIIVVFFITALISAVLGFIGIRLFNPLEGIDTTQIMSIMEEPEQNTEVEELSFLGQLVQTFTVSDFSMLFSKSNMLQLIVFSVLFGLATAMAGEKGKPIANLLASGTEIMMKIVKIIMYYAPIGLGAYFATIIGQLGPQILGGYVKVFVLYLVITIIYYFGFFTLYAFVAGGKDGIKVFWKNAITPSVTAIATCSSAACIPVNLTAVKKMGVPNDIAETIVPLGANTHKDGSVFGGVFKIVFLFLLFGKDMSSFTSILMIIGVAFLVGAVMGAIPSGGMIGEMLLLSVFGFPPEVLPIIAVISTIIDAPATLLNSTGNTVCAMMVARLVEGKKWLQKSIHAH
ncbi:dicarboxylate/amino acid:cation symporter [Caldibacillus thermolactis]|uniref:Dicarboxylate/amino acid:cation symporter n=1 Tax=Pallidibacillus thermolactis TaxID=251051 RepID=A0ABT2WFC5_9BACI|nr:dicarboxylate/amino acid:cation symporter [Pallidibacillus thermolactis]MCU9594200.1 dicarboxylate/amino acid:cation symporter [Pallidibacillus thermolactis]MCU9601138.1 dicarboxylate/amino acid:cation symporter [Pallidibacillus thermolactis subsp. kokeshiiformis]MED1671970.1 dicarboxylate/amino acid:cation symporter [Pallidibacillus thermolactis subsp. kokeshiiformis]